MMYLGVFECVVIGVVDECLGEVVKFYVVKSDFVLVEEDLVVYCYV